jgi:hypothetical protein
VNYFATQTFLKLCQALPPDIQKLAMQQYDVLKGDPRQLSDYLKRTGNLWSVKINADYRLIGRSVDGGILFFWIGARKKA